MKSLLRRLTGRSSHPGTEDSLLFSSAFAQHGIASGDVVRWSSRAIEVGAEHLATTRAAEQLQTLWADDRDMARLDSSAVYRLERFFSFERVPANRDLIRQGEHSDFMLVVLAGNVAVDRIQPWGECTRLTEAGPGHILGEMSLLDSGLRFSQCTTLSRCDLAVLDAEALDHMMTADTALAANLIALLARKLAHRLRNIGERKAHQPT